MICVNQEAGSAKDLLTALGKLPINLEILTRTRIGLTVNSLRKAVKDDEATSTIAKELIKRWKKLIENKSENSNGTDTGSPAPVAKTVTSQTSASKSASGNGTSSNNSQVKKPPPITQSVSMDSSTDGVRSKCREMLSAALSTAFPEVFVQNEDFDFSELGSCETIASRIEECIYKEFKNTDQRYKNRVRSRVQNLKDNRNPDLRLNVLRGSITPERIATMEANVSPVSYLVITCSYLSLLLIGNGE